MKATQRLHQLGQSLWLDNITRDMLHDGTLARYINEFSVTGLTSNPTIFANALKDSKSYDESIARSSRRGKSAESIFFELALDDLCAAADLFEPIHRSTKTIDGWVSLEVAPHLANDAEGTVKEAIELHARAGRPNLFIKIPGTPAGITAIEETIFAGVPVNVTLLFSAEQYIAAARAFMRGIERRIGAGLEPSVGSVASIFVSRWDVAIASRVPAELHNGLGIAVSRKAYKAYCELLNSDRWLRIAAAGAYPQRLLWASTGTKDPSVSDTLYVEALAAPHTVDTMPEKTLLAFADHGAAKVTLTEDAKGVEATLAHYTTAGIDLDALALQLQEEGAASFTKSWTELLASVESKRPAEKQRTGS